ncbi:MAG: NifB/NifX family molybdenum-iron cluster-binding protein [Deltaproteobacteria bacterium]|nr:NifB/NifX family molybdenum-iron cluster-binding protein [Deltaproteobacteria bacterium]MBW1909387.1 NifB/NifX family molybdenum-iron cluster-binding protein [Deltaproteobacteria bacterium]MBW2032761.1 NifB/NifX family molybdenum-iron cluster-binding protein [Deltaproteobacteria bacterium]MBW2114983.1 NifB/NifX family molybdenum-iron cluster-binding protein [Deltaproteobacteria bacterium]MBW2168325.1 NifB/NifX family molybdenum-iron cluster-binding protein [Deltaproteobacteria bacterium]
MKIAVTSTGPTLDDTVEERFGRCPYFLIIDPDTLEFEPFENPNIALGGGAGIQSAQLMANKGVSVVLTGNCGPNAFQTFGAAGVQVITGVSGQVRQAIEQYKSGAVSSTAGPNVQSHFGMGMGGGMGRGRGMGMSRGRGMGGEMSASSARGGSSQPKSVPLSKEEELKKLKDQANELHKQIEAIETSMNALEKK